MDYSAILAIVAGVVVPGFALVLFLRRSVHMRGVDITYIGGRAKVDELIVGADREHRAEQRHAVEGKVVDVVSGVLAEKPASIETKREDLGEIAA